jgi:predicted dehydrogenase
MSHRVAILGAGIGVAHLDGYLALGDRFAVTHVCDLDTDRAAALAVRAGAQASVSIQDILADPSVDIVDICLPPAMHVPVTTEALAAGKHVICEKPLAGSVADADRLAETARATGRQVFPVFQYRYGRGFAALNALQRTDLLGAPQVAALETHWNRGAAYYANPWRGTWEHELGGVVLSHAIHIHDLISNSFGSIADVSAMLATRINPIETEDCAALGFRTGSGALVSSSVTLGAADNTSRLRLVYEHATAESGREPYAPGQADWRFVARDQERQAEMDKVVATATQDTSREGFAGYLAAVADALEGRPNNAVTLQDGVASIELATAIYQSDRTGSQVSLPLDRSLPICENLFDGHAPASS